MNGVMAVAAREVEERRAWFGVLLGFALLQGALLMTRLFDVLTRDTIAVGIAVAVPAGIAVALGSSVIAGDMAERRLSFYFSRPLSGFAIWAGKILGATVLTAAAVTLVAGPVLIASMDISPDVYAATLTASVLIVAAVHVVGTVVRSRSGLLPADFAALVLVKGLLVYHAYSLESAGAHVTLIRTVPWVAASVTLVLLLAGMAQVVVGRTHPRRGHAALSLVLWTLAGAGASPGGCSP
jgi:hypothetical protein